MDRPAPPEDPRSTVLEALARLNRAGWSIGDVAFHDGAGGLTWIVSGSNGENLVRAEGLTAAEAWAGAVEQARGVGMLERPR